MLRKNKSRQPHRAADIYHPHLQPIDKPKKHPIRRLKAWMKQHKKLSALVVVILLIGLGGGVWALTHGTSTPVANKITKKQAPKPPQKYYSPLTGNEVSQEDSKRPATAVIIENSPDARPQSGLKEAGVVFESVAEGGITRFLMMYQESKPGLIGPVRSVRSQFASWAAAYDAGVAHVGGSPEPLAKLRGGQIKDLDQFFNAGAYYRAKDRYAPHNVYTTDERLQTLNKAKGYTSSSFTAWARHKAAKASSAPSATTIAIPVSTGQFAVSYQWDVSSNTYLRSEGSQPHKDREGGQLAPNVVIALQVPHDVIDGGNNYRYPSVIGSGKAWLFQDGVVSEITWTKPSDKASITFTDASGAEVKLNPGQTWLTAVKPGSPPTWQ